MIDPVPSRWLVPFEGRFDAARARTTPPKKAPGKKKLERELEDVLEDISTEQRKLMAQDRRALLILLQGLDAGGKDGTIRALSPALDATGCHVTSFKAPSAEELDHDFLWRTQRASPARGTIGIFNRSHYEEVLIVKVEPELLARQRLPDAEPTKAFWE
jgi:polyphosphate kinase 2 (PPK2 family)